IGLRQHVFAGRHRAHDIGDGEHRLVVGAPVDRRGEAIIAELGHIMVADYLPAGLEIDNPNLVSSGDSGTLEWIEDGVEPKNT
ncbi:hypothetical protein FNJ47_47820, partial [Bradyrhizobium sp. UFLA 03-164]|nr:hypothetical protein [Bradyrhizobium uaiense]